MFAVVVTVGPVAAPPGSRLAHLWSLVCDMLYLNAPPITLPKMTGLEIRQGIKLIGEPTIVGGKLTARALANVGGCLALIDLSITIGAHDEPTTIKETALPSRVRTPRKVR